MLVHLPASLRQAVKKIRAQLWAGMDPGVWKHENPCLENQSQDTIEEFPNFPSSHTTPFSRVFRAPFLLLSFFLYFCLLFARFSFCLSPPPHLKKWILLVSGFYPLSSSVILFFSYCSVTPLPPIHISLSLPFRLSSFISCSARVPWRQSCIFSASCPFLQFFSTPPSVPSLFPRGHGSLFPLLKFVLGSESDQLRTTKV